jgi:hypothetical protein
VIFDRFIRTWVDPTVKRLVNEGELEAPVLLIACLAVWPPSGGPVVYMNDKALARVRKASIKTAGPTKAGQAIHIQDVRGLHTIVLDSSARRSR